MQNRTQKSLLELLGIRPREIVARKSSFDLTDEDSALLRGARPYVEPHLEHLVEVFYAQLEVIPDVTRLIGDADTLGRLKGHLRRYVGETFLGDLGTEYVGTRLRIGQVHRRIGVEPKLYLSAVHRLKQLIIKIVMREVPEALDPPGVAAAIEKVVYFDTTLVIDTYIRGLLGELEEEKLRTEVYAADLELQVRERTERLERESRTDPLTGVMNARHLLEALNRELRRCERHHEELAVAYLDVDAFKAINDTHGHLRGDDVLRHVGRTLGSVLRVEDTCFRHGGDEFCVILPGCDTSEARRVFVQRFATCLDDAPVPYTVSVGVSHTGPDTYLSPDDLLRLADEDMYRAKQVARRA